MERRAGTTGGKSKTRKTAKQDRVDLDQAWLPYKYTTEITSAEALDNDRYLVTGRLTGNFPGGTADLKWDFTIAGQHITRLTIAP